MEHTQFDPAWVAAARAGDQSAVTRLYNATYQNVYLTIRSMFKGDRDTVLDLLQDTYLKAFGSLDQLQQPEQFNAWVKSIARSKTLDHLRKTRVVLFSELAGEDGDVPESLFEDRNIQNLPERAMDQQETARLIRSILDALPEGQRAVIGMYYVQGMKIREIAQALNRSEGTIKVQLRNGRKSIENRVNALELKEGIKLHSMAPMAFLLALLRSAEGWKVQPDAGILSHLLEHGLGQAAASQAGTAVASGTAKTGGAAAAKSAGAAGAKCAGATAVKGAVGAASKGAAVKIIAGVLAGVLVLGGGTAGFVALRGGDRPGTSEGSGVTASVEATDASDQGAVSTDTQGTAEDSQALAYAAYAQVYSDLEAQYGGYHQEIVEFPWILGVFYSKLVDLTGDGLPELVTAYGDHVSGDQYPSYYTQIWSWDGTQAKSIYEDFLIGGGDAAGRQLSLGHRDGVTYLISGEIAYNTSIAFRAWDGTGFSDVITFEFNAEYGEDPDIPYLYGIDGQEVTYEEYTDTWNQWWSGAEIYNPHLMATMQEGGGIEGVTSEQMVTQAQQAVAETKAALGMSQQEQTDSAQGGYSELIDLYSAVINGQSPVYGGDLAHTGLSLSPIGAEACDENGYLLSDLREKYQYAYSVSDINSDGTDELLIRCQDRADPSITDYLVDIYTMADGQPVWLIDGLYRNHIDIGTDGVICRVSAGGAEANTYRFYTIEDGALLPSRTVEENWGEYAIDGAACTEEEFQTAVDAFQAIPLDTYEWTAINP